jgi:hypothetical protein
LGGDVAVLRDPTGAPFVLFAGDIDP